MAARAWGRCQGKHRWAGGRGGEGVQGLWASGARHCGHSQDPLPSQEQRTHYPHIRKARFSSVGRTWPPAGSWLQQVNFLSHPALPSSRLLQEGPVLLPHRGAPARKCHRSLLQQGLASIVREETT